MENKIRQLNELNELLKKGVISFEEFQVLKSELLNSPEMLKNEQEGNHANSDYETNSKEQEQNNKNSEFTNSTINPSGFENQNNTSNKKRIIGLVAVICIIFFGIYYFDFFEIYYFVYTREIIKYNRTGLISQYLFFFLISLIPALILILQLILKKVDNSYFKKLKLYFENLAYPITFIFLFGFTVNLSLNIFFEVISLNGVSILFSFEGGVLMLIGFIVSLMFFLFWFYSIRSFFKGLNNIVKEENNQ